MKRKIVRIDEEKCNGCGLCAEACAEGAIRIVDGKAKLVSESYCDGLGACLGECPEGAIIIEEREAAEFDEKAAKENSKNEQKRSGVPTALPAAPTLPCGCPGSKVQDLKRPAQARGSCEESEAAPLRSRLSNWPVQIKLLPVSAPFLQGARLLIAADCAPFAYADFHRRFMTDRVVLIGCPKLDDAALYQEKLTEVFQRNDIAEVEVVYMEVPCCFGLVRLVSSAIKESGKPVPLMLTKLAIRGEELESREICGCGCEAEAGL